MHFISNKDSLSNVNATPFYNRMSLWHLIKYPTIILLTSGVRSQLFISISAIRLRLVLLSTVRPCFASLETHLTDHGTIHV